MCLFVNNNIKYKNDIIVKTELTIVYKNINQLLTPNPTNKSLYKIINLSNDSF